MVVPIRKTRAQGGATDNSFVSVVMQVRQSCRTVHSRCWVKLLVAAVAGLLGRASFPHEQAFIPPPWPGRCCNVHNSRSASHSCPM